MLDFFPSSSLLPSCSSLFFTPRLIMPYHHILPVLLISVTFFPLHHYSVFHSDYFSLSDLSPSPTPSPVCCIFSHFLHEPLYPLNKSNKCLRNCTTFLQSLTPFSEWFHHQLLNQTWLRAFTETSRHFSCAVRTENRRLSRVVLWLQTSRCTQYAAPIIGGERGNRQ